ASHFVHIPGLSYSGVKSPTECQQSLFEDRKSGSAGMPRPISYAVFCLKKKSNKLGFCCGENPNLPALGFLAASIHGSPTRYLAPRYFSTGRDALQRRRNILHQSDDWRESASH